MDAPGWDSLRSTPKIPAKRSWDGDASPSSLGAGPRSGEGGQLPPHLRHVAAQQQQPPPPPGPPPPNHASRRTIDASNQHIVWDMSPQVHGWPMKTDPARHGSGSEESYGSERRPPVDAHDTSSLNTPDHGPPSFTSQTSSSWAGYRRESNGSGFQTAFDPPRPPSSNEMSSYPGSQETRSSSFTRGTDELGVTDPPRSVSAKVSIIEQNCERCNLFRPQVKDFISMMQKLETSLGPFGPYQEIHEHCLRQGTIHDEVPNFPEIHRIFDLLGEVNELAKLVVQLGPVYLVKVKERNSYKPMAPIKMETNFPSESDDASKKRRLGTIDSRGLERQSVHPGHLTADTRRHSSASPSTSERLPPIYFTATSHMTSDASGFKLPSMNPPPTPGRHMSSPPTRPRNSPPSYNAPPPATSVFPSSSPSHNVPQPPHQPLSPSLSSTFSSRTISGTDATAVAAHAAALQHEVSVKSYALQTLQQEHDKLLAALSRSQTRARALEEKQVVADNEVNVLSEDRARLVERIAELEKEVSEITEARDEYRNAGVKEGKQYVEIVRMASRLELMAAEERRVITAALAEKEKLLKQKSEQSVTAGEPAAQSSTPKAMEGTVLHQLNTKCANYEAALRDIKRKRRRIDDIITELGSTQADISQSLTSVLGEEPEECA